MKTVIYGTGKSTRYMVSKGWLDLSEIVCFIQSTEPNEKTFCGKPICSIDNIPEYDIMLVSILDERAKAEVYRELQKRKHDSSKIFCINLNYYQKHKVYMEKET